MPGDLGDLPFTTVQVSAFLLVLARTTAWAVTAPLVGARTMSGLARLALGITLAVVVMPTIPTNTVPSDTGDYLAAALTQTLAGLVMGYLTGLVLSAVETAGALADNSSGLSFGAQVDPSSGQSSSLFARFLNLTMLALLAATDGLRSIVAGFVRSFQVLGLNGSLHLTAKGGHLDAGVLGHLLGQTMVTAAEIAGPLIGAMFVTDAGMALVARFVPQANILSVALSVKALVALASMGTILILLPAQLESLVEQSNAVLRTVGG